MRLCIPHCKRLAQLVWHCMLHVLYMLYCVVGHLVRRSPLLGPLIVSYPCNIYQHCSLTTGGLQQYTM